MFDWMYSTPLYEAALLMAVLFIGFTWIGGVLLAPFFRVFVRSSPDRNSIVGNILSSFGVFYGILLGLTAVAAYQNWSTVDVRVTEEAEALRSLYIDVSSYPEPHREHIGNAILAITEYSMGEEWQLLREGGSHMQALPLLIGVRDALYAFEPETNLQIIQHTNAIEHFNQYLEDRRFRIHAVSSGIPSVLWYVVIIGAILNIVFIWLLNMKFVTQMFLGGLLSFYLGAMILLIARLDKPFHTIDGITPVDLVAVHKVIKNNLEK